MKRPKITRQISSAALGLFAVAALLLASGFLMFTGSNADPMPPRSLGGIEEVIPELDPPLASPDARDSLVVTAAMILVVFAFVLVWFLVFRPVAYDLPPEQEMTASSSQES